MCKRPFAYYRKVSSRMDTVLIASRDEATFCVFSCTLMAVFLFVPSVLALWCEMRSASDANSLLFKLVAVETDSLPFVCAWKAKGRRFNLLTAVELSLPRYCALIPQSSPHWLLHPVCGSWIVNQPHSFTHTYGKWPIYFQFDWLPNLASYSCCKIWLPKLVITKLIFGVN